MTKAADRMNREDAGLKHEGMAPSAERLLAE
jgi:hypothetical protein